MDGVDGYHWNLARCFVGITIVSAALGICCNLLIVLTTFFSRYPIEQKKYIVVCKVYLVKFLTHESYHTDEIGEKSPSD